jgi:tetratricopeptide (TPR) repeat protein
MIKKYIYPVLILSFVSMVVLIILFRKENPVLNLKERKGTIALSSEWINTKAAIEGLLSDVRKNPDNLKAKLHLAEAYIQEARVTGDHAYYDNAALQLLNTVINKDHNNFEALCCKATVLLSQHHFSEGLTVAQQAKELNPYNGFVYGLLCDANVELGHYEEAVKMADKMVSIRPDLKSYARVSYLREIYGDMKGAIEAMKLAVSAGFPGLEQTAWTRVNLGHLYENTGDLIHAEGQYSMALSERPEYAFALAGMASIEKAKGNYKQAIAYLEKAKNSIKEFSFNDQLTDLYALNKDLKKSYESAQYVVQILSPQTDTKDDTHGHYADKELAYAYLKTYQYNLALDHALKEFERRPDNIDVIETVAWVRYKRGEYKEANDLIKNALRTHSQNPVLLCRAGLIKIKAGNKEEGIALINKAVGLNPFLDKDLTAQSKPYLVSN